MSAEYDMDVLRRLRKALSHVCNADYALGEALRSILEEQVPASDPQERARVLMHLSNAMHETALHTEDKGLAVWSNALAVAAVNQKGLDL